MSEDQIISEPNLLEKLIGCFLGVLLGDAMGMPWEMMSHKEILFATRGRGVSGFSKPVQLKILDTRCLEPGQSTDDWQLTRAVCRSLIQCQGFDLLDCAREQIVELDESDTGFGKSTKSNLEMLKQLLTGNSFQFPRAGQLLGKGMGNGVAMKISPLAIFYGNRHEDFFDATIKLAGLTHRDPQAFLSAYALGLVISQLMYQSVGFCSKMQLKDQLEGIVNGLIVEIGMREFALFGSYTQFHSNLLALGRLVHSGKIADIDLVMKELGTSYYCAESIPFSIAMFLRHPIDFRAAIIETINCGGDTDTNASMVGAMVGMNLGAAAIPEEWRKFRPEYSEAGDLALALYNLIKRKK